MPDISKYMIKASFFWLFAGGLTGALLLAEKAIPFWPAIWLFLPVHVSTMIFGWMLQFVLGVAYWMLPKYRQEPSRGRVLPAKVSLFALNTGVIISSAGHLAPALGLSPPHAAAFLMAGYLLATAAVTTIALLISPRIISYRGNY